MPHYQFYTNLNDKRGFNVYFLFIIVIYKDSKLYFNLKKLIMHGGFFTDNRDKLIGKNIYFCLLISFCELMMYIIILTLSTPEQDIHRSAEKC